MTSENIARNIAEDLLNNDVLDEHNFNYDTDTILDYVQNVVIDRLKDFLIIQGNLL